jgi:hypothetical protein
MVTPLDPFIDGGVDPSVGTSGSSPPPMYDTGGVPNRTGNTTSTTEWLNWVRSQVPNSTATDAGRQLTMCADREPIPLIYGEDRVGAMILNILPIALGGVDCIVAQCLWGYPCDSMVGEPTFNDGPLPKVSDALGVVHFFYNGYGSDSVYTAFAQAFYDVSGVAYTDTLEGWCVSYIYIPVKEFNGSLKFEAVLKGRKVYDPRQDAASNLLTYSDSFTNWTTASVTIASDNDVGPFGTTTADRMTVAGALPVGTAVIYKTASVSASTTYTFSFYVKLGTLPEGEFKFAIYNATAGSFIAADIDPSETLSAASYKRVVYTFTTPVGCTSVRVYAFRGATTSGGTFYLDAAQFRAGSDPGDYNKTGASLGTQVLATPTTWTWSDNPSLCDADFLANFCGKAVDSGYVVGAANANDALVSSEKRRTLNVTFRGRENARSVSETLRAYSATFHVPGSSGIKLIPDRPGSSVATYTHAAGQIASVKVSKKDSGNFPTESEVVYTNRTVVPWKDDSVFVEVEGVSTGALPRRLTSIRLPGINRFSQAEREAWERLNRMRTSDMTVTLDVFDQGIAHEEGDIITANHPLWNTNKLFRIGAPEAMSNGMWRLSGVEYQAAGYSDTSSIGPIYTDTGFLSPTTPPSTPAEPSHTFSVNGVELSWAANPELTVVAYELRKGTSWADGTALIGSTPTIVGGTTFTWPVASAASYTIWLKAITGVGTYSTDAVSHAVTVSAPVINPTISQSLVGADYLLTWSLTSTHLPIAVYRVRKAGVMIAEINSNEFRAPVDWTGDKTFTVAPVDIGGNEGTAASVVVSISGPSTVQNFRASVVVNTVLFYWDAPAIKPIPIAKYLMRRGVAGTAWASCASIGEKAGDQTFTTFFEGDSGDFVYWIAPVDTAGNQGTPVSLTLKVDSPAGFKLQSEWNGNFSGGSTTLSSAVLWDAELYLPVNATQTFGDHFTTNGWTTPQAQVSADYDPYLEPAAASGYYRESFDAMNGAASNLNSTFVTFNYTGGWIDGGGTLTPTIEIATHEAPTTWVSLGNVQQAFAANFRYIRVTLTAASSGGKDLYKLTSVNVQLALKTEVDSGKKLVANFTGSPPTCAVSFTKEFTDVESIVVTPLGTARREVAVEFTDSPSPDGFTVRIWDATTGTQVSNDFTWQATGVI